MTDFLKRFLLEEPRRFSSSGRFAALAAFGKHPGWDDHIEDLGLETESLNLAKTTLYVNGIGGQIDSGAWEKLDAAQQLPAFQHIFVWQRCGQTLLGRMWSSSDGKGRKRYPMVVCLHFMGVTLAWALQRGLPVLAELEQGCLQTNSAADVRALLARKRADLREALPAGNGKGDYAPVSPEVLRRILHPAGDANPDAFLRVLYQVHSQFAGFAPGNFSVRANPTAVRVQQIRVPRVEENPEQALLFWTRFFSVFLDPNVPALLTLPERAAWADVTAGQPESHEMFCLRATPKAVPLVSEVPYQLEDEFRKKASAFLETFERGETARPDLESTAASGTRAGGGGFLKWLAFGLIVGLGAWYYLQRNPAALDKLLHPKVTITNSATPQIPSSVPGPTAATNAATESPK